MMFSLPSTPPRSPLHMEQLSFGSAICTASRLWTDLEVSWSFPIGCLLLFWFRHNYVVEPEAHEVRHAGRLMLVLRLVRALDSHQVPHRRSTVYALLGI